MEVGEIEGRLARAQQRLRKAAGVFTPHLGGPEESEFIAACNDLNELQLLLKQAKEGTHDEDSSKHARAVLPKDTEPLEQRVSVAQERFQRATAAMAPKHIGGEVEELHAARVDVGILERHLAEAKGEEYAEPVDFPVEWDIGAPLPHVVANDYRTFLIFYVRVADPDWDGTYVNIVNPAERNVESLALVCFNRCASFKLGSPNDEVLHGHPLAGKGLEGYTAQVVRNSRWKAELEENNRVHSCYDAAMWHGLKHFILWFHDSTFECVAESFEVEVHQSSMSDLLSTACGRLYG